MQAIIFDLDRTLFKTETLLHDSTTELLAILQQLGVRIGALSSHDHRVLVRMEEAGIRGYFESVVCSAHVDDAKTVHGIQRVLAELGAQPHQTILASHDHADILLAKLAGLARTIGISHGGKTTAQLRTAEADHIIDDMPAVLDVLQ